MGKSHRFGVVFKRFTGFESVGLLEILITAQTILLRGMLKIQQMNPEIIFII